MDKQFRLLKVVLETFCEWPGQLTKGVLFHQDRAPAQKSVVVMAAVRDSSFEPVEYPPYSPDLAPSESFLFPNMKNTIYCLGIKTGLPLLLNYNYISFKN